MWGVAGVTEVERQGGQGWRSCAGRVLCVGEESKPSHRQWAVVGVRGYKSRPVLTAIGCDKVTREGDSQPVSFCPLQSELGELPCCFCVVALRVFLELFSQLLFILKDVFE